jgi:hypothetical protein
MNYLGQTEYDSITDIDVDIDKYQKNIAGLNKILRIGSSAGQKLAAGKLAEAEKNLAVLLKKRERFAKTLDGFGDHHGGGGCGCGGRGCGGRGGCGCNKPVSMFPCMHCGRHRPKTNAGCPHCGQNAGWAKCGGKTVVQSGCFSGGLGGLGDFDGVVGSLVGNLGVLAIVSASLVAWLIQQNKGGAARDDGLQWYDIAALPTHAVMIPLSYVAKMIGP